MSLEISLPSDQPPPHWTTIGDIMCEVSHRISVGDDYILVLDYLFDVLSSFIPYDRIGIGILEGENEESRLALKWVRSKKPVEHLSYNYSAKLQGSSLNEVLISGKPRIIDDLEVFLAANPTSVSTGLILKDGIRSSLTCPLHSRGKKVGVIFFSSFIPFSYDARHVEIFQSIADEISLVVDYGRLWNSMDALQSKDQSVRMLLHDLRSPLSVILGFLEIAQIQPWFDSLEDKSQNIFRILVRNAKQMDSLLNEVAEMARASYSLAVINANSVDMKNFISDINNLGQSLAHSKKTNFEIEAHENLPQSVQLDREKILRVIENLVSNAVKYSLSGTQVSLKIETTKDKLFFSVKDHGQGIPESEQHKLFREFGKTSIRPTNGEPSTGLGLAIAKQIVERHGGKISVLSQTNVGSIFTFWIPLVSG